MKGKMMSKGKDGREYDGFASFPADGLSDHLPECTLPKGFGDCICTELRAAEQRVRNDGLYLKPWRDSIYEAGVKAARDAVAAYIKPDCTCVPCAKLRVALAAIDAIMLQ